MLYSGGCCGACGGEESACKEEVVYFFNGINESLLMQVLFFVAVAGFRLPAGLSFVC